MLKWLFNKAVDSTSKGLLAQDYIIASDLDNVIAGKRASSDERLYFEAIFLDICDRTQSHPEMTFEINDKGRIIWELDPNFSRESYINAEWFHNKVDLYDEHKTRLEKSKNLYLENEINFLEYYMIRTETYSSIQITDHEQFFKNINFDEYFAELKKRLSMSLFSNTGKK